MIEVRIATAQDFAAVLPLFDAFRDPPITAEHWRRLFEYPWPDEEDLRGFVLRDGPRTVGFFGTILSERVVDGRVEKFANLTSWVTLPEYRNHSLRLFEAVSGLEGRTLTCFTARPEIAPLYRRFGFEELETKWLVVLPPPAPTRPFGWLRGRITTNAAIVSTGLRGVQRELCIHHRALGCGQMLITHRGAQCHVIYTRTKGRRRHFSRIHHISTPEIFAACLDHIRWRLTLEQRTVALAIDARLWQGPRPAFSRETALAQRAFFRTKTLRPEQIDNLYTELVLLPL